MFRFASSTSSVLCRFRTLSTTQHKLSATLLRHNSSASPSLKQKALKAMLNGADPKNINGEDLLGVNNNKDSTALKTQPPIVLDATKRTPNNEQTSDNDDVKDAAKINYETKPTGAASTVVQMQMQPSMESKPAAAVQQQHPAVASTPVTLLHEFAPKIVVIGVGGAGNNAINNMIAKELQGVDFLALNTDAQHLSTALTDQRIQMGVELTRGLGAGANPDAGRMAAEESRDQIAERLEGTHMVFITSGMGGGTGTGASPVVADICQQLGILTVGVVTLPFTFEGTHRKRLATEGLERLESVVDTLITIPNQNLFRLAGPQTTFVEAFQMADDVLLGGVKSITDLMTAPGLINLDFADVQAVMVGMGNALLGTGVSSQVGEDGNRAVEAARLALDNPLLGSEWDIATAKGMLVNITGGRDMTLFEVDKAAQCVTEQVQDANANIIFGSAFDERLEGSIRVSVVATGIEAHATSNSNQAAQSTTSRFF